MPENDTFTVLESTIFWENRDHYCGGVTWSLLDDFVPLTFPQPNLPHIAVEKIKVDKERATYTALSSLEEDQETNVFDGIKLKGFLRPPIDCRYIWEKECENRLFFS